MLRRLPKKKESLKRLPVFRQRKKLRLPASRQKKMPRQKELRKRESLMNWSAFRQRKKPRKGE